MSAPSGLFAAKGQAQPVDQTRGETDIPAEPATDESITADTEAGPLPDLFGEPANDENAETSPGTDENTAGDGDAEPAPAASLLTIVSQRSAARRRQATPDRPDMTPPAAFTEIADKDLDTHPDVTAAEKTGPITTNLPVPVRIQLPMVTANAATDKSRWDRRMAAVAACVAIAVAGAVTILIAGSVDDTAATAQKETPSIAAMPAAAPVMAAPPDTVTDTARAGKVAADMTVTSASAVDPEPPKTTIGSVRIDAKGLATVSGQAPPEAELIVLHNRQPLGTARSDAAGLWTFSARVPTRTNRNEISVVPMRIDNSVMVTDLPAVPRPGRRPAIPSYYFAQIASLPSAADAGREAAKLADKLSGLVATHRISVRVATIENGRKVYRVAIGGFSTKAGAADICGRIRARNTRCLVMRGS